MKLPNAEQAFIDLRKLTNYCLNPGHPRGRHKAKLISTILGITRDHAEELQAALLLAARTADAQLVDTDQYGDRYVIESWVEGPQGMGRVRSTWIIRTGESLPRLVTRYVL